MIIVNETMQTRMTCDPKNIISEGHYSKLRPIT